jgi:phage gp45-like
LTPEGRRTQGAAKLSGGLQRVQEPIHVNESHESRPRKLEYARLSVALMSAGVVVVAVGLATAHLVMTVAGVLVIVAGWLAATGAVPAPRGRR